LEILLDSIGKSLQIWNSQIFASESNIEQGGLTSRWQKFKLAIAFTDLLTSGIDESHVKNDLLDSLDSMDLDNADLKLNMVKI
jgi:hypothetical protein